VEPHESALHELQDGLASATRVSEQETSFRKDCLAAQDGSIDISEGFLAPLVVAVPAVQKRHDRAGIDENRFRHRP
jgi:hypothetical protein